MSDINQPGAEGPDRPTPDVFPPLASQSARRAAAMPPPPAPPRRRKSGWKKVLVVLILVGVGGILLLLLVAKGVAVMSGLVGEGALTPSVYRPGKADQVVAVLEVNGMIDGGKAALVDRFRRVVEKDKNVKAILLRVDSPGGSVSPCDRIYHRLKGLRDGGKRPAASA